MGVKIIPENISFSGAGAEAERKVLEFLKLLPDTYYVLHECKIYPSVNKHATTGSIEDRPDFIVIGPEIGVVVLEVKDWNINTNLFTYHNQKEIIKTNLRSNKPDTLTNPKYQAEEYLYAVKQRLSINRTRRLWVSSFVVYPKLVRNDFENNLVGMDRSNPQVSFMYDGNTTLFLDDIDGYRKSPHTLLQQYVERGRSNLPNSHQLAYTEDEVGTTVHYLVPAELRVGGLPENIEAEKKLALLDSKQQLWALSIDLQGKKYLADVAGSGKTNILLSRAIYLAKHHIAKGGCLILVVTYSKALELELKRIFRTKIADDLDYDYYNQRIRIYNVLTLMEEIVKTSMGVEGFLTWKKGYLSFHTEETYTEEGLPERCVDISSENKKDLQIFDYLLIDEVQDFSTWFLYVTMNLLKDQQNIFTVGDVGQKLFEREIEWGAFDIVKQRVEMQSRFLMYRSPQPIAKLAWKFLTHDEFIRADLEQEGYKPDIKPKSPFMNKPVLIPQDTEEELLLQLGNDIQDRLQLDSAKKILCIGLKDKMLDKLYQTLLSLALPVRWATDDFPPDSNYILLADYIESKGLEREYVYIIDVDHLAVSQGPFVPLDVSRRRESRDRIKLFVALTRAMREVRLYYTDRYHTFIRELLSIEATIQ